ncbi:MAG: hypothetical protein U0M13_05930 [Desulfovibrio fairfieldensis]|nr:hypothetical protein [Desulfovibrio fairfieldensis]
MELFERVKQVARRYFQTDKALAEALGIPQSTFSAWCNTRRQDNLWPHLAKIAELCPYVRREWLYYEEGSMLEPESTAQPVTPAQNKPDELTALQERVAALEAELHEERRLNRQLTTRLLVDGAGDKGAVNNTGKAGEGAG